LADDAEDEVALRGGQRRVARLVHRHPDTGRREKLELAHNRPFRLQSDKAGSLDHLLLRAITRRAPGLGEVEIAVDAAALNSLDVMQAMGVYPGQDRNGPIALGIECAGHIIAAGEGVDGLRLDQDVVAFIPSSFGTHVTVPSQFVVPRSDRMTAAQAAALPYAFITAWYALSHIARLRAGERILIHAATEGIGLAAIQIARHLGAEVFATAGTQEGLAWLREQSIAQVMDSLTLNFAQQVLLATHGEGVDVVLNSLASETIDASLATLAADGRFIELGRAAIYGDRPLRLAPFKKRLSYSAVSLVDLAKERPQRFAALFREVMDLFTQGVLLPLPVETFPISRAADAFSKLTQGQHLGKLVLTLTDPDARIHVPVETKAPIRQDASYMITGGLGGLGLSAARWLAERNAGHIVLLGRSGITNAEQKAAVDAILAKGTRVSVAKADVSNRAHLEPIFANIAASGMPLRGIIHAAGLLDDGLLTQQTPERFRKVMAPKARGAWLLHELTLELTLDFFVMYSSAAGLLGSPGQGNYAAANTFLDALAHHRTVLGLPALSIDWGVFSEVGGAAAQDNRGARMASRGIGSLTPDEGLTALGCLLEGNDSQLAVMLLNLRQWASFNQPAASSKMLSQLWAEQETEANPPTGDSALVDRLANADPRAREALLLEILRAQAGQVLRIPESSLDVEAPFSSLGIDSLMGLELRNRIETVLGIKVPATLVWTFPTVMELARHLSASTGMAPPAPELNLEQPPPEPEESDSALQTLSDDELADALRSEL
jgi:NADPH:quinone reductase-like Zn-dependent oxidoreductase/acyl carrier protein